MFFEKKYGIRQNKHEEVFQEVVKNSDYISEKFKTLFQLYTEEKKEFIIWMYEMYFFYFDFYDDYNDCGIFFNDITNIIIWFNENKDIEEYIKEIKKNTWNFVRLPELNDIYDYYYQEIENQGENKEFFEENPSGEILEKPSGEFLEEKPSEEFLEKPNENEKLNFSGLKTYIEDNISKNNVLECNNIIDVITKCETIFSSHVDNKNQNFKKLCEKKINNFCNKVKDQFNKKNDAIEYLNNFSGEDKNEN